MAYIITILFITSYGLGLLFWEKKVAWRLKPKMSTTIKSLHFLGLFICILVSILYSNFNIGLRGLWTTRIIIIFTLLTGIFFIFIANKTTINKIEKWYFNFFSFLPIVTAGVFFIPFLGVVFVISLFGQLTEPATRIYYEDNKIRVQSTFVGVLGPPKIDIFEKNIIFEKHLKRADFWANEIDSIKVSYDKDSTRIIAFGLYDFDDKRKGETETICLKRLK